MTQALAATAVLDALGAVLFLYAAGSTAVRGARTRSSALVGFATFWAGVGVYALADGAAIAGHLAGWWPYAVAVAALHVKLLALVTGFGGLVAYILHLYTGRTWPTFVVAAYSLAVLVGFQTFYALRSPEGVAVSTWGVSLAYRFEGPPGLWPVLLVALLAPPLCASLAYARLYRVAPEPRVRQRILATSLALSLFFAPTLAAWLVGDVAWWGLAEKVLALVTGVVMVLTAVEARRAHDDEARAGGV